MTSRPSPKRHPYQQWAPDARALNVVGDKWTLLIIRDLVPGPRRFVELHRVLPGISNEQLQSRLTRMVAAGLLTRRRYNEVPPRVDYELTARARDLMPILAALARWGRTWEWTEPRDREAIDIGAILRLAPGLVSPCPGVTAVAEFTVQIDETTIERYTLTGDDGSLVVEERAAPYADVRVRGTQGDWVAALGPCADAGRLRVEGDALLAGLLLSAIGGAVGELDAASGAAWT